jgi:hypothetical protein
MSGVLGTVSVYLLEGYVCIILRFGTEALGGLHALRHNTRLRTKISVLVLRWTAMGNCQLPRHHQS